MDTVNIKPVAKELTYKAPSVEVPPKDVVSHELTVKDLVSSRDLEVSSKGRDKIEKTVSELNDFVQNIQRGIQFSLHEETGRSIVIITDKETGDVLRKFPSDEVLAISAHIAETLAVPEDKAVGLIVNGQA